MGATGRYFEVEDGLVYLVTRRDMWKKSTLRYAVVCPYCYMHFDVEPSEGAETLRGHYELCGTRPRRPGEGMDAWMLRRFIVQVKKGAKRHRDLTPDLVSAQQARLNAELTRLTGLADASSERVRTKNPDTHELAPQRAAEHDVAVAHSTRGRVYDIEEAVRRLTSNRYGICFDCDGDIEIERLEAVPATTQCIRCALWDEDR